MVHIDKRLVVVLSLMMPVFFVGFPSPAPPTFEGLDWQLIEYIKG